MHECTQTSVLCLRTVIASSFKRFGKSEDPGQGDSVLGDANFLHPKIYMSTPQMVK